MKKTNKLISIDFGQSFVKVAYISFAGSKSAVLNYALIKIAPEAKDEGLIVDFIKDFIRKNSIPAKEAILNIWDTQKVFIKYLVSTAVPHQEMLQAIKWQIKPELPFDAAAAIIDWQVVKEYKDEEGVKKDGIICIAAEKEFINKYLSIIQECGLKTAEISSAPFNYSNILPLLPKKLSLAAVLDIGYRHASLCIYKDNKLTFVRDLIVSSDKLAQSLTSTLASDKGKIGFSIERAQGLIEKFGIPRDQASVLEGNIQAMHIISLMRPYLEGLAKELKRSFDYFSSLFKEEFPAALYITGGGAKLKNLDWYLNKELGIETLILPLPETVDTRTLREEKLAGERNQIANLIGGALGHGKGINLLPHEVKARKAESVQKVFLRLVSITAAAIFLSSLFMLNLETKDYRNRLRVAKAHRETIKEVKVLKRRIELKEGLIHKIKLKKVPAFGLLKLIGHITPDNIVIDEFSLEQVNHIVILKGEVFAGANTAESELTEFMKKLEGTSFFSEATLISSRHINGAQEFEINCSLNH